MSVERAASGLKSIDRESIAEVINRVITPAEAMRVFEGLQDPAPSGTEPYTRTPKILGLLDQYGVPLDSFRSSFAGTQSPAVLLTMPRKLWVSAHSDTISYLVARPTNDTVVDLMPLAAHRPAEAHEWPAAVLRFSPDSNGYELVSEGIIGSDKENGMRPYYFTAAKPANGFIPGLDRFVFSPEMQYHPETGLVEGNVDNAGGIAVSILAINALAQLVKENGLQMRDLPVGFVFPGEEEGLPDQSAFFARGARQIIHNVPSAYLPKTIIEVDGQDIDDGYPIPDSALLAAYISGGKSAIVAPHDYERFNRFLEGLAPLGTNVQASESVHASVSRSNDPAWIEKVRRVIPLGYGEKDPYFNKRMPQTNINALVNNAKAVTWLAASMKA